MKAARTDPVLKASPKHGPLYLVARALAAQKGGGELHCALSLPWGLPKHGEIPMHCTASASQKLH